MLVLFTEFVSKTNQGGLIHRKKQPKTVTHHANMKYPERCLVRLFKLYNSKCPEDRPDEAFYLCPLNKPKPDVWYQKAPVGHNTLAGTVPRLFTAAGIAGHYSNHSLRVTTATRLFDAGLDEQLIMSRTGHSSNAGVRSYKRITTQLQEKTSEILNVRVPETRPEATTEIPNVRSADTKPIPTAETKPSSKENKIPPISFVGATNFTVNL